MNRNEYWKKERFGSLVPVTTAKRLHNKAQGWRAATTLGSLAKNGRNPIGVAERKGARTQGSRRAATQGFVTQPLRGWRAFLTIFALSMCAFAQNSTSITGRVIDPHGASVAGAEVRVRSRSGSQSIAVSDDHGAYAFKNVAPGDYVLEIDLVQEGVAFFKDKGSRTWRTPIKVE